MVKIAVAGLAGRMGRRIAAAVINNPRAELVGALEAPGHPVLGTPINVLIPEAASTVPITDDPVVAVAEADVLIEFTSPKATLDNLNICATEGKACVIGTTGLKPEEIERLKGFAQETPVVFAPNMSVGMNLMFKLVGAMTRILGPDYALEVVEAHHDQKKDAPSGTAVRLIDELAKARGWNAEEVARHGRCGLVGARTGEEIGVGVIRGGDIVGDHTVYFIGQGERLELTHRAHSRNTFAQGAVRAALWLKGKGPGLYDMADVLGLKDL